MKRELGESIGEVVQLNEGLSLLLCVGPMSRAVEGLSAVLRHLPADLAVRWHRLDEEGPDLPAVLRAGGGGADPLVLAVFGLEVLYAERRQELLRQLNLLRDLLPNRRGVLLLWIPRDLLVEFQGLCPDLYQWRSLVLELSEEDLTQGLLPAHDVVLCMGPETQDVWQEALGRDDLRAFMIQTPPMGWHRKTPVQDPEWGFAARGLRATLDELRAQPFRRLHVFANGPYGLAALLAVELEDRFGRDRQVLVYQRDAGLKRWVCWGVLGQPVPPAEVPATLSVPAAPAPVSTPQVAVALNVLHDIQRAEAEPALRAQGITRCEWLEVSGPRLVRDRAQAERLAADIDELLRATLPARYPGAAVHLFYPGPLTALLLGCAKLQLGASRITIYDRQEQGDGSFRYAPVLALPERRLLSGDGLIFLAVADEWYTRRGGISTFNRELCKALAAAGYRVLCHIKQGFDSEELDDAERAGVKLLLQPPREAPDIIIGHDHVTGEAARELKRAFPASTWVHMIHTAPDEIEWLKGERDPDQRALQKTEAQVALARDADRVFGIGPLLTNLIHDALQARLLPTAHVFELTPWLVPVPPSAGPPREPRLLLVGRPEHLRLKGIDLAVRAVERLPSHPPLYVRGAAPGSGPELAERLTKVLKLRMQSFQSDEARNADAFRQATVVLMPSRSEGFGLVGLEAIAFGVPVLISAESGLGRVLRKHGSGAARRAVVEVSQDDKRDVKVWSDAISDRLQYQDLAFQQARALREELHGVLSATASIRAFVQVLSAARGEARAR